jgi:nucleolar protein 14
MEREQEDNLRHQLDQDFDALRLLLYAPDPSSTGSNSVPLGRIREDTTKANATTAAPPAGNDELDYDTHVRELAFDKRAQPKDRTKTEEELALEAKEALEKAERKRRKRMLGEDEAVESDEDGGRGRAKSKRKRERGPDDLDDDFNNDEELGGLGIGLGEQVNAESGASTDDGSDTSEEDGEEGEDDAGQEDSKDSKSEADSDDSSEGEEGDHNDLTTARKSGQVSSKHQKPKELPFTFPCPETHGDFLEIVEEVEDSDIPTVVKRIMALYHSSLAPENKFKLQV